MSVFIGTFVVFALCCLLLGLGLIIDNRKLAGGCGHKPAGAPRCEDCPHSNKHDGGAVQGECKTSQKH